MIVSIYARVSTDGQTTDNQIMRLSELASNRGYGVFDVYSDVCSGAVSKRPELDRMMHDAKLHLFDKILCTKLDRMARSVINLLEIMTDLKAWGVQIEFIDQPIDTSTPAGNMMLTVLGALAEFERELISDRTKDGLKRAEKEGRKGGRPRRELSEYQRKKAIELKAENPQISINELCNHFTGISRQTLTNLLRKEGII